MLYTAAILLLFTLLPGNSTAGMILPDSSIIISDSAAGVLLVRLNEIKEMDKSTLSSLQKKELRKEVKSIRQELRESHRGIYLSVGAVIIIILLLILLL